MDFSDALKAMKAGKKIRRPVYGDSFCYITHPKDSEPIIWKSDCGEKKLYSQEVLADDWKIVEDVPEIKLFRSKDIYFICPKCQRQQEQLVYVEDRPEEIIDCRFCGQKFKFGNLEEMKKIYYGVENTDIGVADSPKIGTSKPQSNDHIYLGLLDDLISSSLKVFYPGATIPKTYTEAENVLNKTISNYYNTHPKTNLKKREDVEKIANQILADFKNFPSYLSVNDGKKSTFNYTVSKNGDVVLNGFEYYMYSPITELIFQKEQ